MAKGELEFGDGLTPVQGVAVMQCIDEEGQLRVQIVQYGDVHTYQAVGLLTGALDVVRGQLKGSLGDAG